MVQDANSPPVLEQFGVKNNYAFVKNMTVSILENQRRQIDGIKKDGWMILNELNTTG